MLWKKFSLSKISKISSWNKISFGYVRTTEQFFRYEFAREKRDKRHKVLLYIIKKYAPARFISRSGFGSSPSTDTF